MAKLIRDDVDRFLDYDIYIPTRTITIGTASYDENGEETGTDFKMAERAIKNLHILDSQSDKPITIIMNNIGGWQGHGNAIFDAIRNCRSHVTIQATGHVQSMGSVIFQAADQRVMMPTAEFMMHYGELSQSGHPRSVEKWVERNKKYERWMEDLYLSRMQQVDPKMTRKKLQEMLNFDTILNAQETVNLGLADKILEPPTSGTL